MWTVGHLGAVTALAQRLRELRARLGLQQRELAHLLGVPQPTLSCWETGRSVPSTRSLRRIVATLGPDALTVADLLGPSTSESGK